MREHLKWMSFTALVLLTFAPKGHLASVPRLSAQQQSTQGSAGIRDLNKANELTGEVVKLFDAKKFKDALPLAQSVVEIRHRLLSPNDSALGSAYTNLAEIYFALKKDSEAEDAFKQALAVYEAQPQQDPKLVARTLERLAYLRFLKRDFETADSLYIRELELKEKEPGATDAATIAAMKNYACFRLVAFTPQMEPAAPEKDPNKRAIRRRAACWLNGFKDNCATIGSSPTVQGVLNGKAVKLAQPPYPTEAREKHVSGKVFVAVQIDETGDVIEAKAICGSPAELAPAGLQAARASKFTPTKINDQAVKVSGVIVYNFVVK